MKAIIAAFLLLLVSCMDCRYLYNGYQILQVDVKTDAEARFVRELVSSLENELDGNELEILMEPISGTRPAHILVPPSLDTLLRKSLLENGFSVVVVEPDLQTYLDEMFSRLETRKPVDIHSRSFVEDYHSYEDIVDWMHEILVDCEWPLDCEITISGFSHEGRPMETFHIRHSEAESRGSYWVDSLIHAREWMSAPTAMNMLFTLIHDYGQDDDVTYLMNNYDFHFMIVANPDGYAWSWDEAILWRKNRRVNDDGCFGVDLNRNFPYRHCMEGADLGQCNETYCGPSPGSEPETQAMMAELEELAPTLRGLLTLHTYGWMWMYPWGNTEDHLGEVCERADDHDDMDYVAQRAGIAISETNQERNWTVGTSCEVIYETTGSTSDYAKGVLRVKYPIAAELRGHLFPPPEDIVLSSWEIWNGFVEMILAIEDVEDQVLI